ncbi:hypothetical protein Q2T40_01335 [Winogradskyella maritima]|nr:hypothetical protein [Winogradskyella maritima]
MDEAILFVSIASNFEDYLNLNADERKRAKEFLNKALNKEYLELKSEHINEYQKLFHRVALDLGSSKAAEKPTNERLANFRNTEDPSFVALYFHYGRYLLISSSQPGGQPANLQGIWNGSMKPAWDSKYTININAEMNYWPAERTNLSELHEPFLSMVKDLSSTGRETAKPCMGHEAGWHITIPIYGE